MSAGVRGTRGGRWLSLPTRRRRPGRRKSLAVKTTAEVLAGKDEVGRRMEDEGRPPDVVADGCLEGRLPEVLAGEDAVGQVAEDEGRSPDVLVGKEAEGRLPEVLASEDEVGRRAEDEGRSPDILAGKETEGRPPEVVAGKDTIEHREVTFLMGWTRSNPWQWQSRSGWPRTRVVHIHFC